MAMDCRALYWMMISLAAWRAVFELRSSPFTWHKTPHTPSSKPAKMKDGTPGINRRQMRLDITSK